MRCRGSSGSLLRDDFRALLFVYLQMPASLEAVTCGRFVLPRNHAVIAAGRDWRLSPASALSCRARERPVERIRECLLLTRAVGSVATGIDTRPPEAVHEVPHREALPDALRRVLITARIEDDDSSGHQRRGERNVGCHGYIASGGVLLDIAVGHVRSAVHPHG